jgi:hypothetical protein
MPRKDTITPEDLREAKCAECGGTDPNCDGSVPIILNSICHERQGVRVGYVKSIHSLVLDCAVCKKHIVTISLAPAEAKTPRRKEPKPAFYTCKKCGFLHPVELRVEACKKDRSLFDMAILNEQFGVDGWVDVTNEVGKQS